MLVLPLLSAFLCVSFSKVYFHETADVGFEDRWVYSSDSSVEHGKFNRTLKLHGSAEDYGLKTSQDNKHYHMSAKLSEPLITKDKDLYFQFVVSFEQDIDCGGGYIKLFETLDQSKLLGSSAYAIMLGPDVCGYSTRKTHVIVSHGGKNHQIKSEISHVLDKKPHFLQLQLNKNKTFRVEIDGNEKAKGKLEDNFEILEPKVIDDPEDKKPSDWVDEKMMDDPSDVKPADWDDRKNIVDPNATKPEDWNDDTDGEWEPDTIPNPDYKGDWAAKKIDNPNYKGLWKAKQIPNKNYKEDDTIGHFNINYVGFDLWQVKSGTLFDEIFVCDSEEEAKAHKDAVVAKIKEQNERIDAEEEAERKKLAEEREAPKEKKASSEEEGAEDEEHKEDEPLNAEDKKVVTEEHSDL